MDKSLVNIMWFRRDLRLDDNAALYHALSSGLPVIPLFIFDENILQYLEDKEDARVEFIRDTLLTMQTVLEKQGSSLLVKHGKPEMIFAELLATYAIQTVFTNEDYESYATQRDDAIIKLLSSKNAALSLHKDTVIFAKSDVVKDDGKPYTVFTPYKNKWLAALKPEHLQGYNTKVHFSNFLKMAPIPIPSLSSIGFTEKAQAIPSAKIDLQLIKEYGKLRDFPAAENTSRIGIHLRFGTKSIRALARETKDESAVFLSELIWRDFYHMILWHFPHVGKGKAFKPAYDTIEWEKDNGNFETWCNGKTGYPIVDAGMRQLNAIGFMHNRVRMITASFLCKHLLLDWRLGEAYFAKKLLDFDLAANNGGWQWASSSGCDAAPYFRIFNPTLQMNKFDADFKYVKTWVKEYGTTSYPSPIVEHTFARERCLKRYAAALK